MRAVLAMIVLTAGCASAGPPREKPRIPLYDGKPLAYYVRQLHDLDHERSQAAGRVLSSFGKAALPSIAEALKADETHVRENAAYALYDLAHLSPLADGVVPLLLESLANDRPMVRWWSVGALGEMRPTPPEAKEALERMLSDPDEKVRESAKKDLAGLGKP